MGSSSPGIASSRARVTVEWRYPMAGCPSTTGNVTSTMALSSMTIADDDIGCGRSSDPFAGRRMEGMDDDVVLGTSATVRRSAWTSIMNDGVGKALRRSDDAALDDRISVAALIIEWFIIVVDAECVVQRSGGKFKKLEHM
mmetsp:Transcript_18577/g.40221  ORF Transcript_18577/g.40221 Transcript_18577/m.40221 type:complete len:141 (+) Transcript_18577:2601-3023(+)